MLSDNFKRLETGILGGQEYEHHIFIYNDVDDIWDLFAVSNDLIFGLFLRQIYHITSKHLETILDGCFFNF